MQTPSHVNVSRDTVDHSVVSVMTSVAVQALAVLRFNEWHSHTYSPLVDCPECSNGGSCNSTTNMCNCLPSFNGPSCRECSTSHLDPKQLTHCWNGQCILCIYVRTYNVSYTHQLSWLWHRFRNVCVKNGTYNRDRPITTSMARCCVTVWLKSSYCSCSAHSHSYTPAKSTTWLDAVSQYGYKVPNSSLIQLC